MEGLRARFYTATGEAKGEVDLPESIFGAPGSRRVLHEAIHVLQGNQRRGTSSTKTRGLVSGGGRKPWKQKGTGNARSGSIRSPLWRKGGVIFGPLPRSYRVNLDQTKRLLALQTALTDRAKASAIGVVENVELGDAKTKEAARFLKNTGVIGKTILVVDQKDQKLMRAFGNIHQINIVDTVEINAWQLMASKTVLFTQAALAALEKRWPKE